MAVGILFVATVAAGVCRCTRGEANAVVDVVMVVGVNGMMML